MEAEGWKEGWKEKGWGREARGVEAEGGGERLLRRLGTRGARDGVKGGVLSLFLSRSLAL